MSAPLHIRVNDRWRVVIGKLNHPTGDRYELKPVENEPNTVLVRQVEHTLWRSSRRKPEPKLVS